MHRLGPCPRGSLGGGGLDEDGEGREAGQSDQVDQEHRHLLLPDTLQDRRHAHGQLE